MAHKKGVGSSKWSRVGEQTTWREEVLAVSL